MPDSDFVTLESMDGYSFIVPRRIAVASGTLKAMLDEDGESPFAFPPPCQSDVLSRPAPSLPGALWGFMESRTLSLALQLADTSLFS